jgi:hypothetical protein
MSGDKSALDVLRKSLEEREAELLRLRREARTEEPLWTPPTREEFDNDWFRPEEALEGLGHRLEGQTKKREIMELLKDGMALAVARAGPADTYDSKMQPFVPLLPRYWELCDEIGDEHFWTTGQAIFTVPVPSPAGAGGYMPAGRPPRILRFFDVRFHPESFNGLGPRRFPTESAMHESSYKEAAVSGRVKDMSRDDAERVSRALVAGWPDITETEAREKALLLFPEHRIPATGLCIFSAQFVGQESPEDNRKGVIRRLVSV